MPRTIRMVSDMETTMMEVERVDRVGDRLMVTGVMMGNFPTEVYLEPADMLAMFVLHLRFSPLSFVIGLPYFWLHRYWQQPENAGLVARAKGLAFSMLFTVAGLGLIAAVLLGVVQLVRFGFGLFG